MNSKIVKSFLLTFLIAIIPMAFLSYSPVRASLVSSFMKNVTWNLRASEGENALAEISEELKDVTGQIANLKEDIVKREQRQKVLTERMKILENFPKGLLEEWEQLNVEKEEIKKIRKVIAERQKVLTEKQKDLKNFSKRVLEEWKKVEKQKEEVKRDKDFYATGFYTSLGAIAIGIFGILLRLPTITLERRLKILEIEQLELGLAQQRKRSLTKASGVDQKEKVIQPVSSIASG